MTTITAHKSTQAGILFLIGASFVFTLMDAAAKGLVEDYPAPMVFWARFLGMLVLVLCTLGRKVGPLLRTAYPFFHLLRSAFQFGATALFFAALGHIGLAEATALTDLAPVLIVLGAAVFLGERLTPGRVLGVILALGGALIIIRPGFAAFTPAALLPLGAAVCYAGNVLLTRRIGPHESAWTAMLYASAFGTLAGAVWLPFIWQPIDPADLANFALLGALGTLAQLAIIRAFSLAEASAIAPFAYVTILFATLWGIIFYGEYPDLATIIGALVIVAAGLYVWHREARAVD